MPNEGFLQRWSRLKSHPETEPGSGPADLTPSLEGPQEQMGSGPPDLTPPLTAPVEPPPLPTLADAASLTAESDYSAFVARGVDASVRRLAMKKLFADPHFNVIDGLDIYMSDYNVPDPVSPAMLASLAHARNIFAKVVEDVLEDDAPTPAPPAQEQE
ncbi:DUF3306 domain-containing protein [Massilia sp. R2A-15]|uniref:DUF3306 domain-containing protein n=1 Tax=Massilia sp. R2A-15 TaxID=3064278 RepID=UPI00280459FD|nr:DUF3306 domain-containing protein [Massilia sp. R2A-15]